MKSQIGPLVRECFLDLGITIVYATIVGLLIVGVVASDDGPVSLLTSVWYASLLPASVAALIAVDIVLRLLSERRERRRRHKASAKGLAGQTLGLSRF